MNGLTDSYSADVLSALIAITKIPPTILEPFVTNDEFSTPSSSKAAIHCRMNLDPDTRTRTTVWISQSHDRQCQNMTIFDGWRICVQVPNEDWHHQTYTAEDVRRAALICMSRQYVSSRAAGNCFVNVREGSRSKHALAAAAGNTDVESAEASIERPDVPPPSPTEPSSYSPSRRSSLISFHTPYPSSQLIVMRPSAPEPPVTPSGPPTADHGHETVDGSSGSNHNQMEALNTPKVISSFFVVSRTDVAVMSHCTTQAQQSPSPLAQPTRTSRPICRPWWKRINVLNIFGLKSRPRPLVPTC